MLRTASDSAATHSEAETAMNMATRLMDRYNLERSDIEYMGDSKDIDFSNVTFARQFISLRSKRSSSWQKSLLMFVNRFVETIGVYDGRKGTFCCYGPEADALIAKEIFVSLEQTIYDRAMSEYGGWFKGSGACFAEGFVSGLSVKLEEDREAQREAVTETGLILTDQKKKTREASTSWVQNEIGTKLSSRSTTSYRKRDYEARTHGHGVGKQQVVGANRKLS